MAKKSASPQKTTSKSIANSRGNAGATGTRQIVIAKKASGTQILETLNIGKTNKKIGRTAARTAKKNVR